MDSSEPWSRCLSAQRVWKCVRGTHSDNATMRNVAPIIVNPSSSLLWQHQLGASVLSPAGFILVAGQRVVLAEALGVKAFRLDIA